MTRATLYQLKEQARALRGQPTRATKQKLYNDRRWRKASKQFKRDNPLCVVCQREGKTRPTSVTDHKMPHHGNERLFWQMSNWQPLCRECHNRKSQSELNQ